MPILPHLGSYNKGPVGTGNHKIWLCYLLPLHTTHSSPSPSLFKDPLSRAPPTTGGGPPPGSGCCGTSSKSIRREGFLLKLLPHQKEKRWMETHLRSPEGKQIFSQPQFKMVTLATIIPALDGCGGEGGLVFSPQPSRCIFSYRHTSGPQTILEVHSRIQPILSPTLWPLHCPSSFFFKKHSLGNSCRLTTQRGADLPILG